MSERDPFTLKIEIAQRDLDDLAERTAGEVIERLDDVLVRKTEAAIKARIAARVDAEFDRVRGLAIAGALEQPLVRTDSFGKPIAEPTTGREILAGGATKYLSTYVNKRTGEPYQGEGKPSGYNSDDFETRAERHVREGSTETCATRSKS